jgi:hypothetical protein
MTIQFTSGLLVVLIIGLTSELARFRPNYKQEIAESAEKINKKIVDGIMTKVFKIRI